MVIALLIVLTGFVHSIPNASKVALSPGPIPKVALPLESSSRVVIAEAVIAGLLTYGLVTPGPILMVSVPSASNARVSYTFLLL